MTTVYRAANDSTGEHWAYDIADAVAYRHNAPFGGDTIYQTTDDGLHILDLRQGHEAFLNEVVGSDWVQEHEGCAAWALEDEAVKDYLKANGYDAIRYLDDYPNEADVLYVPHGLTGEPVDLSIREGLAMAIESIPAWRAHSLHAYAAEWVAERVTDDDGDGRDADELDSAQVLELLRSSVAEDGDFTLRLNV